MKEFVGRQIQFILMLLIWIIAGQVANEAAMGVVVLSLLLLKKRNLISEMILGFIFILFLSDSRQNLFEFAKHVKDIYLILLTMFYLFDRKTFNIKNPLIIPMIPFLIWAFVVIFRSPDMMPAFQKTLSYTLLYGIIPGYFIKAFQEKGSIFLKDFIYMIMILFGIGVILIFLNPDFVFLAGRYCGMLGNPNGLGIFVVLMIMLIVITQLKFPDLFTKQELKVIYILLGVSVILCGSRNALMCIGIFLAFTKFYKISYWYGFITVIIAILLYQVVFANLPTILEMLGLAEALRADSIEDGSGRMVAWAFALNQLYNDYQLFIFGNGFNYEGYMFYEHMDSLSALGHQGGVHNTYLALWLNTGLIGLTLWFSGILRLFFKAVTTSFTALPILYAILFSAFFEAWLMGSLNPYHITFLLIICVVITNINDFADFDKKNTKQLSSDVK